MDPVQATTSIEKVQAAIEHYATQAAGDAVARSSVLMIRQLLSLPDDPAVLDEQLVGYAQLCLAMRSDGSPELHIAGPDGTPLTIGAA